MGDMEMLEGFGFLSNLFNLSGSYELLIVFQLHKRFRPHDSAPFPHPEFSLAYPDIHPFLEIPCAKRGYFLYRTFGSIRVMRSRFMATPSKKDYFSQCGITSKKFWLKRNQDCFMGSKKEFIRPACSQIGPHWTAS